MNTSMKSIAAALSAAMFCLMSCVNLSTGGNEQTGGGNPKDDTPSSKDDEPKKDDSGDVYVLESVDCEYVGKDGTRSSYRCFEKPVYITPEWSNVPVLQSFTSRDKDANNKVEEHWTEYVYMYPSKVLCYKNGDDPVTLRLNGKGMVEALTIEEVEYLVFQYDSDEKLAKMTEIYRDASTVEKIFYNFSYDSHQRMSKIESTMDDSDGYELFTFEYSSTPSKTLFLPQIFVPFSMFYGLSPVFMSDLFGKSFSDCLPKSVTYVDDEGFEAGEDYSYVLDSNGYVKEMKTRKWENGKSGSLTTLSSSFEWKRL